MHELARRRIQNGPIERYIRRKALELDIFQTFSTIDRREETLETLASYSDNADLYNLDLLNYTALVSTNW